MSNFSKQPEDDPYRYGAPEPAPSPRAIPAGSQHPTGKQILTSSWALLKQDRELIALPVLGMLAGAVAFLIFFVPGLVIGLGEGGHGGARVPVYVASIIGGFVASIIGIYFQAALVIGAYQRADGGHPTLRSTLADAWTIRGKIFAWAMFTTIVGTVIRAVEQRLGIVGRLLGFLGGIAWAVATFFAVPVIVAEGVGPIDALKKSASTIREIWGTSVRTTLRFGLIQLVLLIVPFVLLIGGISLAASGGGSTVLGVIVAGIGGVLLIALSTVFGAISTYARALIYRWATGRPVPGIDPALFAGAFRARGRQRRS